MFPGDQKACSIQFSIKKISIKPTISELTTGMDRFAKAVIKGEKWPERINGVLF